MSNAVYNRIRGVQIEPTKKAILMALANIADDSGSTRLFAPVERLVYETCFKERTVRDALKQLEQIGAIKIKYRTGMPSTYLINPALSSPARDFGDDDQETFESVNLQSDAGVLQLAAGVALLNAGVTQLDAPLHLMQEKCSQMQGGGAANAELVQFNCEKVQSNAPYTSTSYTSLTSSTSAQDAHAPESVKTDKPEKQADPKFNAKKSLLDLGCGAQIVDDFLTVRKAKKAPLTKTSLDRLTAQATKAGITTAQAIEICAAKNWQSFDAGWEWRGVINIAPKPAQPQQQAHKPVVSYIDQQTPLAERQAFAAELLAKLR